jgi:hypothetical protein
MPAIAKLPAVPIVPLALTLPAVPIAVAPEAAFPVVGAGAALPD